MQLEASTQNGVQIVRLAGRLDVSSSPGFLESFKELSKAPTVLDMGQLVYLSSAGLRALHLAAKASPGLVVANFSSFCKEIYDVSGFSAIVPEFVSVEEAVEALASTV